MILGLGLFNHDESYAKDIGRRTLEPIKTNELEEDFYLLPYRKKKAEPYRLLRSLSAKQSRFAWEYYKKGMGTKTSGDQFIRFWSENGIDEVNDALLTTFEDSDIDPNTDGFMDVGNKIIGAALHLDKNDYYPLRMKQQAEIEEERERLAESILSALRDSKGEYVFQILFRPAHSFGFEDYVFRETFLGMGPRKRIKKLREREQSVTCQELATDIDEKMSSATNFKFQIRVLGSKASEEELVRGIKSLSATLRQFGHRTDKGNRASLKFIAKEELGDFIKAMRMREFYNSRKLYQRILPFVKTDPYPRYLCAKEQRWFFEIPIFKLQDYQIHDAKMAPHLSSAEQTRRQRLGEDEGAVQIGTDKRGGPVSVYDWEHHVYISGKTGVGKSTVMQNVALSKIADNENVIVLDPHGDLVHGILKRMNPKRLKDVIYVSPLSPIGFNALSIPDFPKGEKEKLSKLGRRRLKGAKMGADEKQSRALAEMTKDHFGSEFWGPRLESIFEWFTKGLLNEKGSNFVDFYHILNDKETARKFAKDTSIEELENYVHTFFDQLDDRDKHSTLNKIGKIRRSRVLRKMLCIREPDIDVSDLIQPGKVVLVNLSKGLHDKDKAHFVGSALSNLIWSCIGYRQLIEEAEDRGETYLFADEFQSFATDVFEDMLSEGRKFGLRLILANQYTHQLSQEVWRGIAGNVGTFVSFAGANEDAERLSFNFGDLVEQHEFVNLEKYNALVKYPKADVIRVRSKPPADIKNEDALEKVLQRMEQLSPNLDIKFQRANTPRWESKEAYKWDLITGIYRKQIEEGGPPRIRSVKEEEPRNNLVDRLRQMDADGEIEFNPTDTTPKTAGLNQTSIEELVRLIGTSNKAGGKEHKEEIVKLWELLEGNAIRTHIIRQHKQGIVPDLTIEHSNNPRFDWGGIDIEVEKNTKEVPTKILQNLASGENKDRMVFFVAGDKKGAEKIMNIIRFPYVSKGKKYKKDDGSPFMPEKEFTSPYWKDSCPVSLNDICAVFIFRDGKFTKYNVDGNTDTILTYEGVYEGQGYIFDEVGGLKQTKLPDEEKDADEDEVPKGNCPECKTVVPVTVTECPSCEIKLKPPEEYRDMIDEKKEITTKKDVEDEVDKKKEEYERNRDISKEKEVTTLELKIKQDRGKVIPIDAQGYGVEWIKEEGDGSLHIGAYLRMVLEYIDNDEERNLEEERDRRPFMTQLSELEYLNSKITSKTLQPAEMPLDLQDLPQAHRYLTIITEGIFAVTKDQDFGYGRFPNRSYKLGTLMNKLEKDKSNAELPKRDGNFNQKTSGFLDLLNTPSSWDSDNRQNKWEISHKQALLEDLYRLRIITLLGEGIYTYPLIYEGSKRTVGRYSVRQLFKNTRIHDEVATLRIYFLRKDRKYDMLLALKKVPEESVSVEEITDRTGLDESEVREIIEEWGVDPSDENGLENLKHTVSQVITPFLES